MSETVGYLYEFKPDYGRQFVETIRLEHPENNDKFEQSCWEYRNVREVCLCENQNNSGE